MKTKIKNYQKYFEHPLTVPEEVLKHKGIKKPLNYTLAEERDGSLKWIILDGDNLHFANEQTCESLDCSRVKELRVCEGSPFNELILNQHRIAIAKRHEKSMKALVNAFNGIEKGEAPSAQSADELFAKPLIEQIEQVQRSVGSGRFGIAWKLLLQLAPYKRDVVIGLVGAVVMTGLSLVPAFLSGYLIDEVIRPFHSGQMNLAKAQLLGWILFGSMAGIYLLKEFFAWVRFKYMCILGEKVARDLRKKLYAHIQSMDMSFFKNSQTGGLITRVSSDTDRIWDFIAFGVVESLISILILSGVSIACLSIDWRLGLIVSLPIPIVVFSILAHGERMKKTFLKGWKKWSDLTDVLSDTIPGIGVVKAFAQEKREKRRFNQKNESVTEEFNYLHKLWTSFWPALMLGVHLISMLVWAFALPRLLNVSGPDLSAGQFVSFLLYLTMIYGPIEMLGQLSRMVNRSISSAYRVFELLETPPKQTHAKQPIRLRRLKGKIELDRVEFSYNDDRRVLKGISFSVHPGEFVGLVGPSGSGKTSIINLLARFYDVNGGKVLVDGVDIRKLDLSWYRSQVAMVLQEPHLFHGTIWENIAYGRPKASEVEIITAAKAANAHEFILKQPAGYETLIGERGQNLSGGERQRISIARAIIMNPKILILDEATSSVDTESEALIQKAIDTLAKGRTVIAIAHRLSTLKKADRIIVVKDGEIVEEGAHERLLQNQSGVFRKLCSMQSLENSL